MSENPLLPHAQLRALHARMVECRALDRRSGPSVGTAREALLAATTIQLVSGDLLSPEPGDTASAGFAPTAHDARRDGCLSFPDAVKKVGSNRLAICAAAARGLQASGVAGEGPLLLTFAQAGKSESGWQQALSWAQQAELPLLLVCADATGGRPVRSSRAGETPITWASISQLSRRTRLPVISVDGEDAVAVYRVMQECVLRTRLGAGPAVIWAIMSPKGEPLPASQQPIARLRKYMAARTISLR